MFDTVRTVTSALRQHRSASPLRRPSSRPSWRSSSSGQADGAEARVERLSGPGRRVPGVDRSGAPHPQSRRVRSAVWSTGRAPRIDVVGSAAPLRCTRAAALKGEASRPAASSRTRRAARISPPPCARRAIATRRSARTSSSARGGRSAPATSSARGSGRRLTARTCSRRASATSALLRRGHGSPRRWRRGRLDRDVRLSALSSRWKESPARPVNDRAVSEESHLDDMRSAIRGDFERLAERRGEPAIAPMRLGARTPAEPSEPGASRSERATRERPRSRAERSRDRLGVLEPIELAAMSLARSGSSS